MLQAASTPAPALLQRAARRSSRRATVSVRAAAYQSPAVKELRRLLAAPGIHLVRQHATGRPKLRHARTNTAQGPCAHDGLSARLIERAGFPFLFMVRAQLAMMAARSDTLARAGSASALAA